MHVDSQQQIGRQTTRRGIVVFLAIAFTLSWLPFAPVLFGGEPTGGFLMPIAPAIAAVVVRKWVTREGFHDAGLRPRLRHWRLYLLAAGWPILTTLVSVPLAMLFGTDPNGFSIPWGVEGPGTTLLLWLGISIIGAPMMFGEELGWRGYLQLRLFPGRPWHAAIATGLIWAAWHYPWLLSTNQFPYNQWVSLVLFTVAVTNASIFFGWLRARSGDVWTASVAHGANNMTEDTWHRVAFTGDPAGKPSLGADLVLILAEIMVLNTIVVVDTLRRRRRPAQSRAHTVDGMPFQHNAHSPEALILQDATSGGRGHTAG
jgi:membrane protease YdiL (CAAX protease family)